MFRSDLEQARVILDVLRWLGEGEKMVLLCDGWDRPVFRHPVMEAAIEEGRLKVLPSQGTLCPAGRLEPDEVVEMVLGEFEQALEEGFEAMAMVWDCSWVAKDAALAQQFMVLESQLALASLSLDITLLCSYDTRSFNTSETDMLRRIHQLVLEDGKLSRNFWVVSTNALGKRAVRTRPASVRTGAAASPSK